ncbi:hypothetical protein YC2023_109731 [Brassica napus]
MISGQSQRHMVLEITRFLKYIYTKFVDMVLGVNQNLSMLIIVLLPRHTPSATSSPYSRPEKFYLNCGSDSNINYGGWTFVGDMISGCNLVSLNSKGSEASNQSVPEIYGTKVLKNLFNNCFNLAKLVNMFKVFWITITLTTWSTYKKRMTILSLPVFNTWK